MASVVSALGQTSFVVEEFAGLDLTFNGARSIQNEGAPTTLNSLDSFTVLPSRAGGSTTYGNNDFYALAPSSLSVNCLVQPQEVAPQSPLFNTKEEYLVAGR